MAHRLGAAVLLPALARSRLEAAPAGRRGAALGLGARRHRPVAAGQRLLERAARLAAASRPSRTRRAVRRWWCRSRSCSCARGARQGRSKKPGRGPVRPARFLESADMAETLASVAPRRLSLPSRARQFYALTKPRVVQLIVFCAVIGMLLATPGLPPWRLVLARRRGDLADRRARRRPFNCLVEQRIDSRMARTSWRATATGELTSGQALLFSATLCGRRRRCRSVCLRQPAHRVADAGDLRRLRRHLHRRSSSR